MPKYKLKRQGHLIIVQEFRLVVTGKCDRINHTINFNAERYPCSQSLVHNKIISEFMESMNGKEYTPDGPTVYCLDCQEDCKHKGMEG